MIRTEILKFSSLPIHLCLSNKHFTKTLTLRREDGSPVSHPKNLCKRADDSPTSHPFQKFALSFADTISS